MGGNEGKLPMCHWEFGDYAKFWSCFLAFDISAIVGTMSVAYAVRTSAVWSWIFGSISISIFIMSLIVNATFMTCWREKTWGGAMVTVLAWSAISVVPGVGVGCIASSLCQPDTGLGLLALGFIILLIGSP